MKLSDLKPGKKYDTALGNLTFSRLTAATVRAGTKWNRYKDHNGEEMAVMLDAFGSFHQYMKEEEIFREVNT